MSRRQEPSPIRLGETVPGSHLIRRYQGDREIPPVYVGPFRISHGQTTDDAFAECARHGYRAVEVGQRSYALMFGEWIAL